MSSEDDTSPKVGDYKVVDALPYEHTVVEDDAADLGKIWKCELDKGPD